jgi:RNA polymerase sigma-70 factor (ECF subfamily)
MDETAVVDRARGGDAAAFELLVRRHTDAVWRLARSSLGDAHAAEDATQETFLKAYRSLGSFRGDAAVRTWLLSICHRTCLDVHRRAGAATQVVSLDEARHARTRADSIELRLTIDHTVSRLPDNERIAFTLVDMLGHSSEDAAAVVGVPASTMRSRVGRARRQVIEAIRDDETKETGAAGTSTEER